MLPAIVLAVPGPATFFIMVFAVLTLVVQLALIVYADATDNSGQPAFLWAIVVFLAPLLGIVLYLLLGRE